MIDPRVLAEPVLDLPFADKAGTPCRNRHLLDRRQGLIMHEAAVREPASEFPRPEAAERDVSAVLRRR